MKNVFVNAKFFKLLLICLLLNNYNALAQKTTIWIVRHAEKAKTSTGDDDPSLTAEGQQRAKDLANELKHKHIKAIYVTNYKRTGQTAKPLAVKNKILPREYTGDIKKFADVIYRNFRGKNVLIIGHSNTVMPLLAAFGADTPFTTLNEGDYDMLFKVTKKESGETELEVTYFGANHHVSELPEKYKPEVTHPEIIRPFTNF
ncbi:phosphoglycerate mutase family protein [Mucilaginibacter segetis]|uniref:Histidine phosphatase family protein n=1 Tax=Mucilaginibacter segetis TaxID=2793071 RepID=A0A934UN95_9SPHI|nr:phosphoglycerate mutase family protein [Mucilaginibacter segetis]MBK0380199.1 histidine phosphatase family protein [Mucilaginibacter segetis]